MSRDNKTSLNSRHGAHNGTQQHERGLFLSFTIFMAWVVGIGLLLSLVTCQPASAKSSDFRRNESQNIAPFSTILHLTTGGINRTDSYQLAQFAFATDNDKGYYIDLSKKHASGQPSRYSLAFFMPDNSAAPQAVTIYSSIAPQAHLSATRGQTIISTANHLLTDYDGLTLQNKIAVRRICRAVACVTESKTRHPIPLPYSVAFTQKTTQGGHYHA